MDMRMFVMDGYEVIKYIKGQVKGNVMVVVVLMVSVLEEEKAIVLLVGCDDFFCKLFWENIIFDFLIKYLGVIYVYELVLNKNDNYEDIVLKLESFLIMFQDWLIQLFYYFLEVDIEQVMKLIVEILVLELELE